MVIIYEATGIAIISFIQSVKKDENLPLLQDFEIWLALQCNLKVKVIYSNNKINWIKTSDWCNNVSILLKPCALDTHVQNGGAERFG